MKNTNQENEKKVVYNFAILSYRRENGKRVILKRLTIPLACTPIESYEEFSAVVESIEKQYRQKYGDGIVLMTWPIEFFHFIQRCDWLNPKTESKKRHVVIYTMVKDKTNADFAWPMFSMGYGSKEVEESIRDFWLSPNGLEKVKAEMRSMGYQNIDNLYVDSVKIFDSTDSSDWDDANVLLFEKEQALLNKDTYMNFYKEVPKSVFNS